METFPDHVRRLAAGRCGNGSGKIGVFKKRLSDALLAAGHPCVAVADAAAVRNAGWDISKNPLEMERPGVLPTSSDVLTDVGC